MNAHVAITKPTIRADETTSERAYRHSISAHCPNCDEMEMAARVDLATIRDAAAVGTQRASSEHAYALLQEVSRAATQAVYAARTTAELILLKSTLTLTMMAARQFERIQRNG